MNLYFLIANVSIDFTHSCRKMGSITIFVLLCCAAIAAHGAAVKTRMSNRGEVAWEGEFPYQVSIKLGRQQHCGGSLISKQHVLTAAHCVQPFVQTGYVPQPMTVEVGMTRLGTGTFYGVKRISYYRGYQGVTQAYLAPNDIAVIHLAMPVQTSAKVRIINLPAPYTPVTPRTEVILSGYGKADIRGPKSEVLKKMDATIISLEACKQYFSQVLNRIVTNDKICAAKGFGYGACQGDSGGPLVDKRKSTVLGVVSAGDTMCSNGQPDAYTDVSQFISYINEELNYDPRNPISANKNPGINLDGATNINSPQHPPEYQPGASNPLLQTAQQQYWCTQNAYYPRYVLIQHLPLPAGSVCYPIVPQTVSGYLGK